MTHARLRVYIGPRRKRKGGGFYPKIPYRYQLPGRPWVCGTGAFTEAATRQLVDRLIQEDLLRLKMSEQGLEDIGREPVQKHLADYLKWGRHGGGKGGLAWSPDHFKHRQSQLREWIRLLKAETLSDIRYDAFSAVNTERLARGLAPNTVNHHAWALVAFVKWCKERGRIHANPLERFTSLSRRPVRERGAFDAREFRLLLQAAPPDWQMVYRMAAYTGLRRSALASLRVKDVDWKAGLVTLQWGAAKNRKTTIKPLPRRLLADLRIRCFSRDPEDFLLKFPPRQAARAIHRDMRNAGIALVKDGRRRDFHSLKTSLGTFLDDMGAPPELTQRALDHASFLQTQGYIKREIGSLRVVVEELESCLTDGGEFHTRPESHSNSLILQEVEKEAPSSTHSEVVLGYSPRLSFFPPSFSRPLPRPSRRPLHASFSLATGG